jgi:antitoxin YefM
MKQLDKTYEIPYHRIISKEVHMTVLKVSEARANLYQLIDETAQSHQPVVITGKRHNAVLVSEDDWRSVQETLYLVSIPGMRESVIEGMQTPVEECAEELEW